MSVRNLIDAIASGDSLGTQTAFETEMMSRIAARMDEKRQQVAQNMFREQDQMAEQVDLDEEQLDEISQRTLSSYLTKKDNRLNKDLDSAKPQPQQMFDPKGKPVKGKTFIDPKDKAKSTRATNKIRSDYEKSTEPAHSRVRAFQAGRGKEWYHNSPESDFSSGALPHYYQKGKAYGDAEKAAGKQYKDALKSLKKQYTEEIDEEQLDEISKGLAARAYNKMAMDGNDMKDRTGLAGDQSDRLRARMNKRWGEKAATRAINKADKANEEVDLDEAAPAAKPAKPASHEVHVSSVGGGKYKVHAVGSKWASGIKPGEHLTDTELDDFSEMGGKIKHLKESDDISLEDFSIEELEQFMQTEDFQQLDELSKEKLGWYLKKASQHMDKKGDNMIKRDKKLKTHMNPLTRKMGGAASRMDSIARASQKYLAK